MGVGVTNISTSPFLSLALCSRLPSLVARSVQVFAGWHIKLSNLHTKIMGSRDWFKAIICRKKTKHDRLKQVKGPSSELSIGSKWKNQSNKSSNKLYNGSCNGLSIENIAATHIQAAFRGYLARRKLHHMKGTQRLQVLALGDPKRRQASVTLHYVQSWSKIQAEIRARRVCMVTESRIKQKKQENQLKLESKLHDLEVEWCGGSETMEEILARVHQREEAAVKRERALAYAFSHQWKANPGINFGQFSYALEKESWGWSWIERWTAARPWELRLSSFPIAQSKATVNTVKNVNPATRVLSSVKPPVSTAKTSTKKNSPQLEDEKAAKTEENHAALPTHIAGEN